VLESLPNIHDWTNANRWRNFKLYNVYRLLVTFIFLVSQLFFLEGTDWDSFSNLPFLQVLFCYLIFSIVAAIYTWFERPDIDISVPAQTLIDIVFILFLMWAQNSSQIAIGMLLIVAIVFASLISEGRYAMLYAAVASIGILFVQTWHYLENDQLFDSYSNAALLSTGCFATAWLAHALAKRMLKSERVASESSLRMANLAKINALITHEMPDGVLVVDESLQIQHHNTQVEKLLGLNANQIADGQLKALSLTEVSPEIARLMRDWMNEKDTTKQANVIKLTSGSKDFGLRFLPVDQNRLHGAVIFLEDWSHIQTQAHQVKLVALGRLTANIAHEIRNPLSAISHANQLLQEDEDLHPTAQRMLQIISDNVQRLDQIIKDVLELNRRDRTNQELILLQQFIQDFYTQFCAVEKISKTDFVLEISANDAKVNARTILFDRRHINQILWNLCKNGWRHCKQNQGSLKLSIKIDLQKDLTHLEISDDGDGIADSIKAQLFEPFITTEKTGTGLGLYIARELAEANGAKLTYESAPTGTQFFLHLNQTET
jgi:two-component system, NtrC family, sensor histidine kinase PilS